MSSHPAARPDKVLYALRKSHSKPQLNWALDADYLHKLSPEEKEWLNQFLLEFYMSAPRRKDGKNVHDKEGLRKCWREYFHRRKAECAVSYGRISDTLLETRTAPESPEDALIEYIDAKYANMPDRDAQDEEE